MCLTISDNGFYILKYENTSIFDYNYNVLHKNIWLFMSYFQIYNLAERNFEM